MFESHTQNAQTYKKPMQQDKHLRWQAGCTGGSRFKFPLICESHGWLWSFSAECNSNREKKGMNGSIFRRLTILHLLRPPPSATAAIVWQQFLARRAEFPDRANILNPYLVSSSIRVTLLIRLATRTLNLLCEGVFSRHQQDVTATLGVAGHCQIQKPAYNLIYMCCWNLGPIQRALRVRRGGSLRSLPNQGPVYIEDWE